ncbi:hypothetical protein WMY93_006707 [Mugilogobius chulae]|uniref:Uncharacterized protein n=1 Tax=Mugilogobius chulae TaxID=88201 RepID=A0AAW0PN55_9GOBI
MRVLLGQWKDDPLAEFCGLFQMLSNDRWTIMNNSSSELGSKPKKQVQDPDLDLDLDLGPGLDPDSRPDPGPDLNPNLDPDLQTHHEQQQLRARI